MDGRIKIALALVCSLMLAACGSAPAVQGTSESEPVQEATPVVADDPDSQSSHHGETPKTSEETMRTGIARINDKTFEIQLENNATAQAFVELLPCDLAMEELNGNEKYCYLDRSLPTDSSCPGHIEEGDLMLYGSNCVVLFYQSFDTPYSYTRIGKLVGANSLAQVVGAGGITVSFALN